MLVTSMFIYSIYRQEKAPTIRLSNLKEQINIIRRIKQIGTTICYPRPNDADKCTQTILVFSEASKIDEGGQLGIVTAL